MHEPGGNFESGGEDKAHQDAHNIHESEFLLVSEVFERGDRIRIWEQGIHSHETIVSQAYGGTIECETRQDVDPNPIENKIVKLLTNINIDDEDSWTTVKHEKPKWAGSNLYQAVMTDGTVVYIEKYPKGIEISENRDKQAQGLNNL